MASSFNRSNVAAARAYLDHVQADFGIATSQVKAASQVIRQANRLRSQENAGLLQAAQHDAELMRQVKAGARGHATAVEHPGRSTRPLHPLISTFLKTGGRLTPGSRVFATGAARVNASGDNGGKEALAAMRSGNDLVQNIGFYGDDGRWHTLKGPFSREDIARALANNDGNWSGALSDLIDEYYSGDDVGPAYDDAGDVEAWFFVNYNERG